MMIIFEFSVWFFVWRFAGPAGCTKTGYAIIEPKPTHSGELLKCSFLYNGLMHMTLTKFVLDNPQYNVNVAFDAVSSYCSTSQDQLNTLDDFQGVQFGALWLLHLYTSTVGAHLNRTNLPSITRNSPLFRDIVDTHEFVTAKLAADASKCSRYSVFNKDDSWFDKCRELFGDDVFQWIAANIVDLDVLLKKNSGLEQASQLEKYTKKYLFLQKLALHGNVLDTLMFDYNVQVNWGHTNRTIKKMFSDIDCLRWSTDNLKPIGCYFKRMFDFLKIIALRLTWKHLSYLVYLSDPEDVKYFTEQWKCLLVDFKSYLRLDQDVMLNSVSASLQSYLDDSFGGEGNKSHIELVKLKVAFIENLIADLRLYLKALCEYFGCKVDRIMNLDGEEMLHNFPGCELPKKKIKHDVRFITTIEFYSLAFGRDFVSYLKHTFAGSNFDAIKMLMNYIDEINQYNMF